MSELSTYADSARDGVGLERGEYPLSEALLAAQKQSLEMVVRGAPLPEVLSYLVQVVEGQADEQVAGGILLLDDDGRVFTGAAPSLPDSYNAAIDGLKVGVTVGTCGKAAATASVVITEDIAACPNWEGLAHLPLELGYKACWSQPILARDGRVLGTFGVYFRRRRAPTVLERRLVETLSQTAALAIERSREEAELQRQRHMLDLALDAAEMGFWRYSFETSIVEMSDRAQALYGGVRRHRLNQASDALEMLHPEDLPRRNAALAAASDPFGAGRYVVEYRVRREGGGWRWLSVWGLVEFEGEGAARRAVSIVGASRDISDQKRFEEHQHLLVNELNHRVKNTLASVQSISAQTMRTAPDLESARRSIDERIHSLARAHDVLTSENWSGADLRQVVARALSAFRATESPDVIIEGAPVRLSPAQALGLSMAIHELGTNAVKYGALSREGGRVTVAWRTELVLGQGGDQNGGARLHLSWRETGGPEVKAPERRGFGTRLLERGLAGDLGGETRLEYRPEGVVFEVTAEL